MSFFNNKLFTFNQVFKKHNILVLIFRSNENKMHHCGLNLYNRIFASMLFSRKTNRSAE